MAQAIPLLVTVGVQVASGLLAPKPKQNPVDKGRFDDIRFQTAEEGAFIPLCFGKRLRLAGNLMWGTVTKEYVTHDPGRTAGKGGGSGQSTPPTNNFTYKKSFALLVCATPVKAYRRISENLEAIYNNLGSEIREDFYEAENHSTGGGASIVTDGQCSGGRAVRLSASGHYVEIEARALFAGLHTVSIFYKAASSASVYVSANGGSESSTSLPTAATVPASVTVTLQLRRGANTIKIRRNTGTSDIDRIYVSGTGDVPESPLDEREVTNLIDLDAPFPADRDNPLPFYNVVQGFDVDGYFEGHLTAGGQARFELFAGHETQPQSAIIVAVEGANETPAWRDASYFVAEDYLLKDGQLGNFIFEIEPEIQDLEEILLYLYTLDGKVTEDDCDFSALAGTVPDGFILDHRAPLEEWVQSLESWFNFDICMRGGKVMAVPRGGAVVTRLYERELRAHLFGEERPRAAVKITHDDAVDLLASVDVTYLDSAPSKDFHTGNQTAERTVGFAFDRGTLTFPIVGDADTAHAVGLRYLDALHLAAKSGEIVCGFGKRHLIPTDVVEVELDDGTLYTYRINQKQADLQGMVKFGVVPERASVYSQSGAGVSGAGGDALIIRPPLNTLLVVADCVPVRQSDFGKLILYAAGCPRGKGAWPGFHLNKRDQNGEIARVGGFQAAATIGIVETASQSTLKFGFEATREFIVNLYNGTLESRTEAEVRAERVNLAIYGKGDRWEVVQFVSVEAQTPTAPFVSQYRVTGMISGLFGTEVNSANHDDDDFFVLVDSALQSFLVRPADVTLPFDFIAQTAGQALGDAESAGTTSLTIQGNSLKPLAIARVILDEETQLAPRDSEGAILTTVEPRTNLEVVGDEYLIEYWDDSRTQLFHSEVFAENLPAQAVLNSLVTGFTGKYHGATNGNTFSLSGSVGSGRAVALQQLAGIGAFVEAELRASGAIVTLGLISAGKNWRTDSADFRIVLAADGLLALSVYEGSTLLYTEDPTAYSDGGTRFRMDVAGKRIRFYRAKTSDGSQFLAESAEAPVFPLRAIIGVSIGSSGDGYVKDIMLASTGLATTILTAAQQEKFYGGLKQPAQVRILQHSGIREVGYGFPWDGAI